MELIYELEKELMNVKKQLEETKPSLFKITMEIKEMDQLYRKQRLQKKLAVIAMEYMENQLSFEDMKLVFKIE